MANVLPEFNRIMLISSSLLVFSGLYLIKILTRKILLWTSDNFRHIAKKLNLQSLGLIFFFSLWWLILEMPAFQYQAYLVKASWCMIIFFGALLILDVIFFLLTDFYLPSILKINVPQIISNLIRAVYFIGVVFFILGAVLKLDIKPFLTGSAIVTAILGLALQDTLGNLFSGLALHISRPFRVGNWIKFDRIEGIVVKIDWRATTIRTREEDFITIPNSQMAKTDIINYSAPTNTHALYCEIGVGYEHSPSMIRRILSETIPTVQGVSSDFSPEVQLIKYNKYSIDYRVKFFIDNYQFAPAIRSSVYERMWYALGRNGVVIPFPINDVYIKQEKPKGIDIEKLQKILGKIDFLGDLSDEEIREVASMVKVLAYSKGEEIIQQGTNGDLFYIIKSGKVNVIASNPEGDVFLTKELEEGNFFGEISVLTGEPRTATIKAVTDVELLILDKSDFDHLIRNYPNTDKLISQRLAVRQQHTFEQMEISRSQSDEMEAVLNAQKQVESLSQQILEQIRSFFSLS